MKVIKLKLLPADYYQTRGTEQASASWKQFKKTIRDISYQISQVKNSVISLHGINTLQKKTNGEALKFKDYAEGCRVLDYLAEYKILRGNPIISSSLMNDAVQSLRGLLSKKHNQAFWNGDRALSTFRRDGFFDLTFSKKDQYGNGYKTSGAFWFEKDKEGHWSVVIRAYSCNRNEYEGPNRLRFPIQFGRRDTSAKKIFERIVTREYVGGSAKIGIRGKDIFIHISYENNQKHTDRQVIKDRILGVNLGIKQVATCVCFDNPKIRTIVHEEVYESIVRHRALTQKKKTNVGKAMRPHTEKRRGHGVKNKIRALEPIKNSDRNFQKTINHQISASIVRFALRIGAECITLEDLSKIYDTGKAPQRLLRRWAYHELQKMIEYKAKENGINTVIVDAQYVSQTCSQCGHCEKKNRVSRVKFVCKKCGAKLHAEFNATHNVAAKGYEKYVETKSQQAPSGHA